MRRIHCLVLAVPIGCGGAQGAAPDTSGNERRCETSAPDSGAPASAEAQTPDQRRALMRRLRDERERQVIARGETFARIAVAHDYSGEYVLLHDRDVTAFLDIKDPQHPRYQPGHDEDGPVSSGMVRAHVLVVPNQRRESIGTTMSGNITADDLEQTLRVMHAASDLATRLGIRNARVYVKSPARIGVGYLHIHLVGERDPNVPYPPRLP